MVAAAGDRNVWVVGGGDLAQQFADEGLLDELILTVVPVVLGSGLPTFAGRLAEPLRLTGVRPYKRHGGAAVRVRARRARSTLTATRSTSVGGA